MKILVCIPVIYNGAIFEECLKQLIDREDVDIFIYDNASHADVKDVIRKYEQKPEIFIRYNEVNNYVNKAWNTFIKYFLNVSDADYLCILNSDLTLQEDWDEILRNRWEVNPDEIIMPVITDDKIRMYKTTHTSIHPAKEVYSGTPGVFITLNKKQAELVYPLPYEECKLWFGDNWIFDLCRAAGYKTIIPENLMAYHHWSTSVQQLPERDVIIKQDKDNWEKFVQTKLQEKINSLKQNLS